VIAQLNSWANRNCSDRAEVPSARTRFDLEAKLLAPRISVCLVFRSISAEAFDTASGNADLGQEVDKPRRAFSVINVGKLNEVFAVNFLT
jgi:hypothetical protein